MNIEDAAKILRVSVPYVRTLIANKFLSEDLTDDEVKRYRQLDTARRKKAIREHLLIEGEANPYDDESQI